MDTKPAHPRFLIREVHRKDLESLMALANTPGMFNLPTTPEGMKERIEVASKSFRGDGRPLDRGKYVFVAEDLETGRVVATSMIVGQHGTEASPHYYFKVGTEKRFSDAIQTGFIHGTLTLKMQTDGPTELGALVASEEYRNHPEKVGRQVFFTRFLFLSQNRDRFKDQIIAELLPPLNKKGHSPLWEAVGRRFTNLDYWEADALSAQNKEFIFDLFPQGKIYTAFLAADARNAIGRVSKATEPVLHLLKRIGFTYQNEIDPFDGGPHLRARVNEIIPLKKIKTLQLKPAAKPEAAESEPVSGLVTPAQKKDEFRALNVSGRIVAGDLVLNPDEDVARIRRLLKLDATESVIFLPYF